MMWNQFSIFLFDCSLQERQVQSTVIFKLLALGQIVDIVFVSDLHIFQQVGNVLINIYALFSVY